MLENFSNFAKEIQAQFICISTEIMQTNKISSKKASFPAVWRGLSEVQQTEVRRRLVTEIGVVDITLYRWREGKSVPQLAFYRTGAARILSEVTGQAMTAEDLFPLNR